MAVRLHVKEVAKEKGISMGKLQRDADVAYNTVKRIFKDPDYVTTFQLIRWKKRLKTICTSPIRYETS